MLLETLLELIGLFTDSEFKVFLFKFLKEYFKLNVVKMKSKWTNTTGSQKSLKFGQP